VIEIIFFPPLDSYQPGRLFQLLYLLLHRTSRIKRLTFIISTQYRLSRLLMRLRLKQAAGCFVQKALFQEVERDDYWTTLSYENS
jgi:hypothetical protein